MIRDDEINRLVSYAKGLGVKVTIYQKSNAIDSGQWLLDGTEIMIYSGKRKSKTDIILDLIHELGHQLHFIHEKDRLPDIKFEEAITRQNLFEEDLDTPTPKHLRKKILDVELAGTTWWEVIYKDTNMKFPIWKLHMARDFDIWSYEFFHKNGSFPQRKDRQLKSKELLLKYKNKEL